jgi:hypothetical protein
MCPHAIIYAPAYYQKCQWLPAYSGECVCVRERKAGVCVCVCVCLRTISFTYHSYIHQLHVYIDLGVACAGGVSLFAGFQGFFALSLMARYVVVLSTTVQMFFTSHYKTAPVLRAKSESRERQFSCDTVEDEDTNCPDVFNCRDVCARNRQTQTQASRRIGTSCVTQCLFMICMYPPPEL